MKRTPLYEEHLRLGGRMVEFSGWELPVMYTSIIEEHTSTRTAAGIFDVSHMGEFVLNGPGAEKMLRGLVPTSMDKLRPGMGMYTCLCNPGGGVIDDIFIFMKGNDEYFIVVNASRTGEDLRWMEEHRPHGTYLSDVSADIAKIDLQGPASRSILKSVTGDNRSDTLARFHFYETSYRGGNLMISQTGYTGESGFELFMPGEHSVWMWRALLEAGAGEGLKPAGLGARDTLRLEAAYSLYGHELNETISPVESGLSWLVSSGDDYVGRDILVKQKTTGAPRELVCFVMQGRAIPREGCAIRRDSAAAGVSTSGGYSPTMKKGIGMGIVTKGILHEGDAVDIDIRGREEAASIVRRPFYSFHG